jgi:hypothetical protein
MGPGRLPAARRGIRRRRVHLPRAAGGQRMVLGSQARRQGLTPEPADESGPPGRSGHAACADGSPQCSERTECTSVLPGLVPRPVPRPDQRRPDRRLRKVTAGAGRKINLVAALSPPFAAWAPRGFETPRHQIRSLWQLAGCLSCGARFEVARHVANRRGPLRQRRRRIVLGPDADRAAGPEGRAAAGERDHADTITLTGCTASPSSSTSPGASRS